MEPIKNFNPQDATTLQPFIDAIMQMYQQIQNEYPQYGVFSNGD